MSERACELAETTAVSEPVHILRILRELGLPEGPLERAESDSNEVWIGPTHVVRFHGEGPPGRLKHDAGVASRLPAEALHPKVVASGWTDVHDWTVLERAPGEMLSVVWPSLSVEERRQAITQFGDALKHVHAVTPDGLEPPCLFGGMPLIRRDAVAQETLRLLREADGETALLDRVAALASSLVAFVTDPADALIHGDLNFNNILWSGRVTALLDFEWARAEARDVDLLSFLAFCGDAVLCVPESVQSITKPEQYEDAPRWLRDAYPGLFEHPRVHERVTFYGIARWAQGLHRSAPGERRLAHDKLVEIVEGRGPASLLSW